MILYDTVIFRCVFGWIQFQGLEILVCISRLVPEKACVVTSSEVVFGVPYYGAGNIISSLQVDMRWGEDA